MKAMILAAGLGTRMKPLTDHCPKPLLPVAGKPLIQHLIEKLVAVGFQQIVINHAYLGHMIEAVLGNGEQFGCKLLYSAEAEPLETAGGIIKALPLLTDDGQSSEPFLLVNGDVWVDWDFADVKRSFDGLGYLFLVANPEFNLKGDFVLQPDGTIIDRGESQVGHTFSGISWLSPQLFNGLEAGKRALAPVLRAAMAADQMRGELLEKQWIDVGTPQRLQQVESLISV